MTTSESRSLSAARTACSWIGRSPSKPQKRRTASSTCPRVNVWSRAGGMEVECTRTKTCRARRSPRRSHPAEPADVALELVVENLDRSLAQHPLERVLLLDLAHAP